MSALPSTTPAPLSGEARVAVLLSLSRLLGEQRGCRAGTHQVAKVLAALAGLEVTAVVETRTGKKKIGEPSWPSASRAFRKLGMTDEELDDVWAVAKGNDQRLPEEVVLAFFPEELWPAVWTLIAAGPQLAAAKVEAVFSCWALGNRLDGSKRRRGKYSAGSISSSIARMWQLFDAFTYLRGLGKEHKLLCFQSWSPDERPRRPSLRRIKADYANRDRTAPPLLIARRLLRQLDADVEERRGRAPTKQALFTPLRTRAIVALLMLLGTRRGAFRKLNVGDFEPKHIFPDGTTGPALRVPGIKTNWTARYKGLPPLVAQWVTEYLEYAGIADDLSGPMWRPAWPRGAMTRLTSEAIEDTVVRAFDSLMPGRRFSPHTLRHLAEQLAFRAGTVWLLEATEDSFALGRGLPSSPQTFADCLLDRELNDVIDAYKDIKDERGREHWAREAALGVWEFLWGDRGARKAPDLPRIARTRLAFEQASTRVDSLESELDALERRAIDEADRLTTKHLVTMLMQVSRQGRLLANAKEERERARTEHEQALGARIPLPDEVESIPTADDPVVELPHEGEELDSRPILRNWCTPNEFRWAFGADILPASTLRRWMSGKLPHPAGDRRNIFDPPARAGDLPDAVERISERKYRIRIDKLDLTRLHEDVVARLDEIVRTAAPTTSRPAIAA